MHARAGGTEASRVMMKLSGCDCPSAGPHPVRGRHHRHEDDVIRIRTSLGLCTAQTHPIHSVVHDLVHDSWCHGGFVRAQLSERLLVLPAFQDFDKPPCTMPISPLGKRIKYDIKEYHPVRHFLMGVRVCLFLCVRISCGTPCSWLRVRCIRVSI